MFPATISAQLRGVCGLAIVGLALLGTLFFWNLLQENDSSAKVDHSRQRQLALGLLLADLQDVDGSVREFVLTGEDRHLDPYRAALSTLPAHASALKALSSDGSEEQSLAERLDHLIDAKLKEAAAAIAARQRSGAAVPVSGGIEADQALMDSIRALAMETIAAEQDAIVKQAAAHSTRQRQAALIAFLGGGLVAALLIVISIRCMRAFRQPLREVIDGTARLANGDLEQEIPVTSGSELGALADALNDMAKNMRAEKAQRSQVGTELRQAYKQLSQRTAEVEARGRTIDLLGKMAHRLQSCGSEEELTEVVRRFAALILPQVPGALFLLSNSRNKLHAVAEWNDPVALTTEFRPQDCWALRRGQPHVVGADEAEVTCRHVAEKPDIRYRCFPMMAQGDTLGLLYIEDPVSGDAEQLAAARMALADHHRIEIMVENIVLALGNHRLREALRNQSIRDPLTGMFNRRYLEEAFELEVARAARARTPIAVLMIDIDHFKLFNDTFGHDAGDAVLKAAGEALVASVRRGDIACRYGGEEFTIIAPGASLEDAAKRAESLRQAVAAVRIVHQGRPLGPITCSIGVAGFPVHGAAPGEIIKAADEALYHAKQQGRDRVVVSPPRLPVAIAVADMSA